jgi:hypothetical protein
MGRNQNEIKKYNLNQELAPSPLERAGERKK